MKHLPANDIDGMMIDHDYCFGKSTKGKSSMLSFCKFCDQDYWFIIKGAPQGLRQILASESPLKKMKKAIYFTLKALFILKIFKFLS